MLVRSDAPASTKQPSGDVNLFFFMRIAINDDRGNIWKKNSLRARVNVVMEKFSQGQLVLGVCKLEGSFSL